MFENSDNVKWLMDQDWIVDYNQYKGKTPAEIMDNCKKLVEQGNAEAEEFNAKNPEYREKHFLECRERLNNLEHELDSLEIMTEHINKKIEFVLPEQTDEHSASSKNAKRPGFFARLFGHGTQQ